ncbi:MAG: APC family permease [Chloroflexota bacterium]
MIGGRSKRTEQAPAPGTTSGESGPLAGRKPGDRRVRVERPHSRYFRYVAPGVLEARVAADEGRTPLQRLAVSMRHGVFGRPLPSEAELGERLPKWKALPVFSSDVMSSVAYASEATLFTLAAAGAAFFNLLMPISILIVGLLAIVTFSYRQTIRAYPGGGGSYIVAKDNLGPIAGLVAGASLLTDYVLTVAVSVSAGVYNLASALPLLRGWEVETIVLCILLVTAVNLRGTRESGSVFAAPTYLFVAMMLLMLVTAAVRILLGDTLTAPATQPAAVPLEGMSLLLLMRAFADGCSAMTGTEAVANGVPAFQPPEWKNARSTMATMAILLGIMFLGTSFLVGVTGAIPSATDSVLSQIAAAVFYGRSPLYYVLIFATMGILVLAAQTSFADFPRLSSILARDGYFPRQFALRGERLAFNAGIVVLAGVSIVLVVAFGGNVNSLIPLYAIGVFTAFTLSQAGMVVHWRKERSPGWRRSAAINGLGAVATGIVAVVFAIAKFGLGAWVVIIIVPVLVAVMLFIHREYSRESHGLEVRPELVFDRPRRPQRIVVAAPALTRAVVQAVRVAETMSDQVDVVHVAFDLAEGEDFRTRVSRQLPGVHVVIVESPYRSLVRPFVRYLEVSQAEEPDVVTIVLLPEHLPRHWWDRLLYNSHIHRIRGALVGRKDIVVLDAPYRREA